MIELNELKEMSSDESVLVNRFDIAMRIVELNNSPISSNDREKLKLLMNIFYDMIEHEHDEDENGVARPGIAWGAKMTLKQIAECFDIDEMSPEAFAKIPE